MSTRSYYSGQTNAINTSEIETRDYQNPAYASTLAITVTKNVTLVQVGMLTGAMTINAVLPSPAADYNAPFVGDEIRFLFSADGTNRTATFGTGFKTPGTLTVAANKFGTAKFTFDGNNWIGFGEATV